MTEASYQAKLKRLLEDNGWHVIKLVRLGVSGYPDLQCTHPERVTMYVEVKSDTGNLSPVQQARIAILQHKGFTVHVTSPNTFNDFKAAIKCQ